MDGERDKQEAQMREKLRSKREKRVEMLKAKQAAEADVAEKNRALANALREEAAKAQVELEFELADEARRLQEASDNAEEETIREMQKLEVQPNSKTYSILIQACLSSREGDKALSYFRDAREQTGMINAHLGAQAAREHLEQLGRGRVVHVVHGDE